MPVLIISGMHRSGTSLTAKWLQRCGLFIGEKLLQSRFSHANPEGEHFEDTEFLTLHRQILKDNQLNSEGYITHEPIRISSEFESEAQLLIAKRSTEVQWGWKEPRTSLMMEMWQKLLPRAYILIVYRPYERVADSLLRRKLDHPQRLRQWFYRLQYRNRDAYAAHYIRVWSRYNQDLLTAAERNPEQSLVIRINDLVPQSKTIAQFLNTAWGFELDELGAESLFESQRLKQDTSYINTANAEVKKAVNEAEPIYRLLETWRERSLASLSNLEHKHE